MLNQIFPALAAHGIARNYGNLLLSTLKTSFSYFEKIGFSELLTWPVSRQVLNQIFPALAAHGIGMHRYTCMCTQIIKLYIYMCICVYIYLFLRSRSLFPGDVADVVLNNPDILCFAVLGLGSVSFDLYHPISK